MENTSSIWALEYARAGRQTKVWNIPTKVFTAALLELATIKGAGNTVKDCRLSVDNWMIE